MSSAKPIRVLLVEADPDKLPITLAGLAEITDIEVVSVAHDRQTTISQLDETQPDVLMVDLMLTGYRSIEIVKHASNIQPKISVLALAPEDPPHDRIILAVQAGALGYVTRDADRAEFTAAIHRVHSEEPWLPVQATYDILQDAARELEVSARERRDRMAQIILALIPLLGVLAGIVAFLWRDYWGKIGVRVEDLGIDPSTRVVDLMISLLFVIGLFGPLLYVGSWMEVIATRITNRPRLAGAVTKGRAIRLGRLPVGKWIFKRRVAQVSLALLILSITSLLAILTPLFLVVFIGPAISVTFLVVALDLDPNLPDFLHLPRMTVLRTYIISGVLLLLLLVGLGAELEIWKPDLREDGLYGVLVTELLGFEAQPVLVIDLDEKKEPLGALYLGGNADLYVLYNPCEGGVDLLPVGSSHVKYIDRVICPPP